MGRSFGKGGASRAFARGFDAVRAGEGAESRGSAARRPDIPPAAWCAIALWLACACAYGASSGLSRASCTAAALTCAAAGAAVAFAGVRRGLRPVAACAIGALLGCACGFAGGSALHADRAAAGAERYQTFAVRATEDASTGDFGTSFKATAKAESGATYAVLVYVDEDASPARYGDEFSVRGSIDPPGASSADRFWQQGLAGTISPTRVDSVPASGFATPLTTLRNAAIDVVLAGPGTQEANGVLAGLVCGYRTGIPGETYESFKLSGLAHVIAVSGSHLSLVAGMGAAVLHALRAGRKLSVAAHVMLVASYLLLSGVPVSAVRSAIMATCGVASALAWRRSSSMNGLAICVIAMICVDPACAVSASFALSAASTASIVVFCGLFARWIEGAFSGRAPRVIADSAAITLAASVGSLPLTAALFSQIPTVSIVSNLVAAPLFALACGAGLVGAFAAIAFPELSCVFLEPGSLLSGALCTAAETFAGIPFSCIPASLDMPIAVVATIALAALLYRFWPQIGRAALGAVTLAPAAAIAFAAAVLPHAAADEIVALDVGQGDAILVRSEGAAALVDTGNQDAKLASALARHGVVRLDAVFVTHGDDDHCGSLRHLAGVVEIDRVFVVDDALSCGCDACASLREDAAYAVGEGRVAGLGKGDAVSVGAFSLDVVWPDGFREEGGNADSLCLAARIGADESAQEEWTALLVGDAEAEQLESILEGGVVGRVDVYKVGHHGSAAAVTPELAREMSPAVSVVSVGAGNRYGHPAHETVDALEQAGSAVVRTDESGDVAIRFHSDRISVSTQRSRP